MTCNELEKGTESFPETKLPILKCKCGHEILLLLDLQALGQEIEKHAIEHKKKFDLTQEETNAIENFLIEQAFELFAELKKCSNSGDYQGYVAIPVQLYAPIKGKRRFHLSFLMLIPIG